VSNKPPGSGSVQKSIGSSVPHAESPYLSAWVLTDGAASGEMNTMVRGRHALTTTTMQSALRISRPAIRLADPKLSRKFIPPTVHPFTVPQNPISAAPTLGYASRFLIRATVGGFQARSFASTASNHTRHPRSVDDRRHRRVIPNRPLVGTHTRDDLPGKDRKSFPLSPFRASSFADALVHTIVGVGISGFCKYEHVESNEAERPLSQFSLQELRTWDGTN